MKALPLFILAATLTTACNNSSNDSVEKADSANSAKRDSSDQTNTKTAIASDKETSDFLVAAMDGGIMEVDLGNIAKVKAQNNRVKGFGEMMIKDHSEANNKIKELAAARTVTVPARVSNDKADMIGKINGKELKDFDKAYMDMMLDDHKEDIKEFEEAGNKINDPEVRQFINNTLPVLRRHLDSCRIILDVMKRK
jgi:putative membrane protein